MNEYYKAHNYNYTGPQPPQYYPFPYPLDHFQLHGCKAIADNENILVTAHTGSGKTVLALYGIAKALSEGKKVIYTSPIKTLSNQKYAEFSSQLFNPNLDGKTIGIMTGDIKINPLGDLLIMTAEILRNSLLKKQDDTVYEWTFNPNDVGCVILDEVHFINNPERGKVWEEIIINLPPSIQLIMLSATITGAEEMAQWVGNLKQIPCHLMSTLKRPVPLQHGIWFQKHQKDNDHIPTEGKINYFLNGDRDWKEGVWSRCKSDIDKYYSRHQFSIDTFFNCIKHLYDNDMTPANVFLLNRSLLESYAKKIPFSFVDALEQAEINKIWNKYLLRYRKLYETSSDWTDLHKLVSNGIGIHHAGMIPILKEIVEILYSKGLIKVLLATETFAMGVNMPTKTVVFCQLTKFDGNNSKRPLRPEEYGQMAGRAGRRGKDPVGHIVILPGLDFMSESEAKTMCLSPPQKITSRLSIDPIYVLKQLSYLIDNTTDDITLDTLINKIVSNCNNSLFYHQDSKSFTELEKQYWALKQRVDQIESANVNLKDETEIYKKIIEIDKRLNLCESSFIRLAAKYEKKLINEKNELLKKLDQVAINKFDEYFNLKNELDNLEKSLGLNKTKINEQISLIVDFLISSLYLDENLKLTKFGKIIAETNECNPFLLGELVQSKYFNTLDFSELIGVLSIFVSDNKKSEEIYVDDLICVENCKDIIYEIQTHVNKYCLIETELNNKLPYPTWLEWNLDLSSFNSTKAWAEGKSWGSISIGFNSFQGNFIKSILRITNLLKNIESIAKIFSNVELLNKLEGYQEKLIRDIVITDSLYLC